MSKIAWDNLVSTEFVDELVVRLICERMGGYHNNAPKAAVEYLKDKEISIEKYSNFFTVRVKSRDNFSTTIYHTQVEDNAKFFAQACERISKY